MRRVDLCTQPEIEFPYILSVVCVQINIDRIRFGRMLVAGMIEWLNGISIDGVSDLYLFIFFLVFFLSFLSRFLFSFERSDKNYTCIRASLVPRFLGANLKIQ